MASSQHADEHDLSELAARLSRLSTAEEKVEAIWSLPRHTGPVGYLHSEGNNPSEPIKNQGISGLSKVLHDAGVGQAFSESFRKGVLGLEGVGPSNYTLCESPCANVDVASKWACPNRGTSNCSSCKIVTYCSKVSPPVMPVMLYSDRRTGLPEEALEESQRRYASAILILSVLI